MDDTQVQIFIDNSTTPSILPLSICNKHPILQKYPKTESYNPIHILPCKTGIISLALKPSKTSFFPCHTVTGKGIAYIRPFNLTLPLRTVDLEFENNRCCLGVYNTSDSTEFQYSLEITYFDARSKGLVQNNYSKHFPIEQYLHDRVTPVTLSPKPLAYEKPVDPTEMPCISTCTEMIT